MEHRVAAGFGAFVMNNGAKTPFFYFRRRLEWASLPA